LFGGSIALGFECLHFAEEFAALLVKPQQLVHMRFIPCPAAGQSATHQIGLFAEQFDVEHRRIIGTRETRASGIEIEEMLNNPFGYGIGAGWKTISMAAWPLCTFTR